MLDTNFGRPVITPDGLFVALASSASNLVMGDRNNAVDISEPLDFACAVLSAAGCSQPEL
ncbi:MAG TPA: hypothetical protein VFR23_00185 [Jiangellaceae bacterium]|nr:hypothetical protein [Jiangellaceae bacterium]